MAWATCKNVSLLNELGRNEAILDTYIELINSTTCIKKDVMCACAVSKARNDCELRVEPD